MRVKEVNNTMNNSSVKNDKRFFVGIEASSSLLYGIVCVVGIYFSFLAFGLFQEQIYKIGDHETGNLFVYSSFLIWLLILNNVLISGVGYYFQSNGKMMTTRVDSRALRLVALASLTYVFSLLCTNFALTHVNFPTQVLVKSGKMVVVVCGGFLIFRKRYPWYDYLSVIMITSSLVMFNLAKSHASHAQTSLGLALLVVSLICDGMTGPIQDRVNLLYKLSSVQMMFFLNFFGLFWISSSVYLLEGLSPVYFCLRNPETFVYLLGFAMTGTVGQFFIFMSLSRFGSLYTSLFTTLRKAASTLLSVYYFNHKLTSVQWMCVFVMFVTLFFHTLISHTQKKKTLKCV